MSEDRIAWIVSRFPVVTETFILREMDEIERRGASIELFSLVRDEPDVLHASAAARVGGLVAGTDLGIRRLAASQLRWLRRRPGRLASAWVRAILGNIRSPRFLARALVVVPVAAYFAEVMERSGIRRVHAHWATHPALAAYVIHLLTDLPYGVTAHAHDIHVDASMLAEKLEAADLVVTVSDFNRDHLVSTMPALEATCSVVRCGVPLSTVMAGPRPAPSSDGPIALTCVASLKPYKGHRHLVAAVSRLGERGHDVICTFAGAGPELANLQALAGDYGVTDRIRFLGAIDSAAVEALLGDTDIFVLPSTVESSGKTEGIPVALMEAMAARVPVVASSLSGIPELIDHGISGLLVEAADDMALAAAIEDLIDDPDLAASLGTAGAARVADEFTIEHNGARLAELLDLDANDPRLVRS